ncbi:hypothetical protein P691DRAFT_116449 [Macrolepiota fuliginosa MF-IS2]|uniref:Uncharacterized protein n=1 Tax=Macrolepiota fuliginosa MF-IS2 TaxID=1400762 RepID=A0A9P6C9C9_9AGAR|nr:hypothetical protein P691DRAFT_116449 [Macrolepiota fuliginosa MF-IS2]
MEHLKKARLLSSTTFSGPIRSIIQAIPLSALKSKAKITSFGLPLLLFILYALSGFISLVLLTLSLLDLGYLSLWVIPPLSLFTVVAHAIFPFLARIPRTATFPSYFSTLVICVYILAIAWFVAFVAALVIAAMKEHWRWDLEVIKDSGSVATRGSQIVQVVLSCLECGLLGAFGVWGHRRVLDTGEPEFWRPPLPEEDKTIVGLSTVVFDSRGHHGDDGMKQIDLAASEK